MPMNKTNYHYLLQFAVIVAAMPPGVALLSSGIIHEMKGGALNSGDISSRMRRFVGDGKVSMAYQLVLQWL